jgi:hypothetical protein
VETNDSPLIHKLTLALSQNKPNQKLDNNKLHRSLDLKRIDIYHLVSVSIPMIESIIPRLKFKEQ